jgi:hypothetical protein
MPTFRRPLGRLFYCLISVLVVALAVRADGPFKTRIVDNLYRADGSPARGRLFISWPAFVTADGKAIAAGSLAYAIAADGGVNLQLAPSQGASPAGTYYKVVLQLDDGGSSVEYWNVPSVAQTTIASIRATVAMRQYQASGSSQNGVKSADQFSGAEYGARIAAAFGSSSVIELPPGDHTATTVVAIPKGGTLRVLGKGTFTTVGIRFTDSITDNTGTGSLECPEGATIKLADGANTDLISQANFSRLTGTLSTNGLWRATVKGCVIDGNRARNTKGRGIALYGWALDVTDNIVQNCAGDGIYTEWGLDRNGIGVDTEMSASFARNTSMNNGGNGHTHYGPHDSMFVGNVYKQNGGWGWTDGMQSAQIPGAKGNGSGSHIWNMNAYNNLSGGIRTTLGVVASDLAVSGTGTAILLDSMAGSSLLTGITASGLNANGVGLECRNGSVNQVSGRIAFSTQDGLKLNGCANSRFDLQLEGNHDALNFAQDSGSNQIVAKVSTSSGQTVFNGTPVISTSTFMRVRADGAVTGNYVHIPNGATGSTWALTDAPQHWTSGFQDFDFGARIGNVDGGIGSVTVLPGDTSSGGSILWRKGNGSNIAQVTGTAGPNLVLDLFNGSSFYVNGGALRVGDFVSSGTIWNTGGDVVTTQAGKGVLVKSPNGSRCARLGIDNSGAVAATVAACP